MNLDEKLSKAYNPDAEFQETPTASRAGAFFESLFEKDVRKPNGYGRARARGAGPRVSSARILEVNALGFYRVREVKGHQAFVEAVRKSVAGESRAAKLVESGVKFRPESEMKKLGVEELHALREAMRESFDDDGDSAGTLENPFNEYLPLMGGPFSKQLYLFDYLDMQRKSFEAWNHNPIAHQIVKLTTYFVLGRGISWKACHPDCQKRFDAWAERENLTGRFEDYSDMLTRDGELMVRKFKNPVTRELFLRWIDPTTIWEIVTDLEDIERVIYYHQQYPTQYQVLYGVGSEKAQFKPSDYPGSKYVINQIPADEVIHLKINCSPNEKRGRSDLFSILGWLKRYKDYWTAKALRAIMGASWAWKIVLKGSQADVDSYIAANSPAPPAPGSVYVENESSTMEGLTLDQTGGSTDVTDDGIVAAIAVGSGISKEYIGFSGAHASRSTAVVGTEPAAKKFQARQLLLGRLFNDITKTWLQYEEEAGRLLKVTGDDGEPEEHFIEPQFPEIAIEDRSKKLSDIETANLAGYISRKRAAMMSAKELGIEGYDADQEAQDIADEKQADAADLYANPAPPLPVPPKPGGQPVPEDGAVPAQGAQGLSSKNKKDIKAQASK